LSSYVGSKPSEEKNGITTTFSKLVSSNVVVFLSARQPPTTLRIPIDAFSPGNAHAQMEWISQKLYMTFKCERGDAHVQGDLKDVGADGGVSTLFRRCCISNRGDELKKG